MTEEIFITFGISVIIGGYVLLCESLLMAFVANLALNFLIFSPVDTFHTSPWNWFYSYMIVILLLVIYHVAWKKQESADR